MSGLTIADLGLKAVFGNVLKGTVKWIAGLDAIHVLALVLGIVCAWEIVHVHGLEFNLIPGVGPKIHIVGMQGKLDAAKSDADKARSQLSVSIGNEAKLRATIADQSNQIDALGQKSANEQAQAQKAIGASAARAKAAEAQRDALRASAGRKPPAGSPKCEPSDTLKKAWS